MKSINYFKADEKDIFTMVDYRLEFLIEFWGDQMNEQVNLLKQQLTKYFEHAIKNKTHICWLAEAENKIVGIGGMTIREQPGNFKNPSGRSAYIMNMYTIPAYRRQGICTNLLNRLMQSAKEMGIDAFELHATKEGEPVYRKGGFQLHPEPTYRKYGFDG